MSATTDGHSGRGLAAGLLSSTDSRAEALCCEVRCQLTEEGLSHEQALEALAVYKDRFQRAGAEDGEDAIVDVMNVVAGWSNSSNHRDPAPPTSLSCEAWVHSGRRQGVPDNSMA